MDHKLKATAKEAELKAHLEGIVGRKVILPTVPIGPVNLFYLLGAFDNIAGYITSKNLLYDNVTRVSPANLIDVSGVSSTDGTGKGVFRLSTFVGGELAPAEPINIVSTASGTVPVFLTVEHTIVTAGIFPEDIEVTVYAWDSNGNPAPNAIFEWRCRFVSTTQME